jgi:transcription elongation factor Elf1
MLINSRFFQCEICGKRFLYSYNVTAHIKHVHYHEKRPTTNEDKLTCSLCGQKFQKIWKTKQHMAEVHKIVDAMEVSLEFATLETT